MQQNKFEDSRLDAIMDRYKTEILRYQQAMPPKSAQAQPNQSKPLAQTPSQPLIMEEIFPIIEAAPESAAKEKVQSGREVMPDTTVDMNFYIPKTRIMFAKGIGICGSFKPYNDFTPIADLAFLNNPTVETKIAVRFSCDNGLDGADCIRAVRGMSVKFLGDTPTNLVATHLPVNFLRTPQLIKEFLMCRGINPTTGIHQKDDLWNFCCNNPQSLGAMMWLSTDLGTAGSYRTLNYYTAPLLLTGGDKTQRVAKFRFVPKSRGGALSRFEAEELAGSDIDALAKDIKIAVEHGEEVQFELAVQLCQGGEDCLDPTVLWSTSKCPMTTLGMITLNSFPNGFFEETENWTFSPMETEPAISMPPGSLYNVMAHAIAAPGTQCKADSGEALWRREDIRRCGALICSFGERERRRLLENLTEELSTLSPTTLENVLMTLSEADLPFGRALALALEG